MLEGARTGWAPCSKRAGQRLNAADRRTGMDEKGGPRKGKCGHVECAGLEEIMQRRETNPPSADEIAKLRAQAVDKIRQAAEAARDALNDYILALPRGTVEESDAVRDGLWFLERLAPLAGLTLRAVMCAGGADEKIADRNLDTYREGLDPVAKAAASRGAHDLLAMRMASQACASVEREVRAGHDPGPAIKGVVMAAVLPLRQIGIAVDVAGMINGDEGKVIGFRQPERERTEAEKLAALVTKTNGPIPEC